VEHDESRNDRKCKPHATASLDVIPVNVADSSATNPIDILIRKENIKAIRAAVKALPPAQREAIQAIWFSGMKPVEYAKETGRSKAAVSQLIDRAFENIKKFIMTH
jgi:RNA polymerase sigma factor (sigma-70 family)